MVIATATSIPTAPVEPAIRQSFFASGSIVGRSAITPWPANQGRRKVEERSNNVQDQFVSGRGRPAGRGHQASGLFRANSPARLQNATSQTSREERSCPAL